MSTPRHHVSICSGKALAHLDQPLTDWAHRRFFTGVEWSTLPTLRQAGGRPYVELVERLPEVGSLHWLRVTDHFGLPRDGGPVWALFEPPLTAVNGCDSDWPEEIGASGLVCIDVVGLVSRGPREAWLRVRVREVCRFTALFDLWPACVDPAPLPEAPASTLLYGRERHLVLWQDLAHCRSSGDDEYTWVLCQRRGERWHLLLHADWWDLCDSGCAGHRVLTPAEAASLGLPDTP